MSERTTTALVPVERRIDSPAVTSESLIEYLIHGERAHAGEFAPELDLSRFKPFFQKIYHETQETNVFTRRQKKTINRYTKKLGLFIDKKQAAEFTGSKGDAERHAYIYFNPDTMLVCEADIVHGKYDSVNSGNQLIDLIKANQIPLIDIHTHPDNNLFSIEDYKGMLVNAFDKRGRLHKASLLICPDVQVLALPTEMTPSIPWFKANRYINRSKKRVTQQIDQRVGKLEKLAGRLAERQGKCRKNTLKKLKQRRQRLTAEEKLLLQVNPEAFFGRLFEEFSEHASNDKKQNKMLVKVIDRTLTTVERTLNSALLEFAREHNIMLYFSTDMAHFKAFSA